MRTASLLVLFCSCITLFTACTNSTDFNTPRTIASDTTGNGTGGTSTLRITSFTPATATPGTFVAIMGGGFLRANAVFFGNVPAPYFRVISDSLITAIVGMDGTSGTVSVRVGSSVASRAGFTFIPMENLQSTPRIYFFSPTGGIGTQILIVGEGFSNASSVNFGGVPSASFTVISSTQIIAIVGTGGTGNVSVTTPSGTASAEGFTFFSLPTITSFTPTSAQGGTVVSINGTNLNGATTVQFGGVYVRSFTVVSPTQIDAILSSTGATGSVVVATRGGTASREGFTFLP